MVSRTANRTRRRKPKPALTARTADKYILYQDSVQDPEGDSRFFARYFKRYTGRDLRILREDFCGTAVMSCNFVKLHRDNRAIGVDLCSDTLAWGREHNVVPLLDEDQRQRLQLIVADVRKAREPEAELTVALNFSYSVFKTRAELGDYIRTAYGALAPGGVLMLDAWGGSETQDVMVERRRQKGFTYVWDQRDYDPVTGHIDCRIHFEFKDGTRMRNAFRYDWRLWSLPELQELFAEAGFRDIHILWEATDRDTGAGNGIFRRVTAGEACASWIGYVVGTRPGR